MMFISYIRSAPPHFSSVLAGLTKVQPSLSASGVEWIGTILLLHILTPVGRPALTGKAPVGKGSALGCFSSRWYILRLIRVSHVSLSSTQISNCARLRQ